MSSGDTLCTFQPRDNEPPSSNAATPGLRNGHPTLLFDTTTSEAAIFTLLLPRNYGGGGITVYITASMVSATSGTLGWTIEIERIGAAQQDLDSDGFASAQTITAATVDGTSGNTITLNVAISNGANMDSVAAGEWFRLRLKRDTTNDSATGDAEFIGGEIKES